MTYRAKCSCGDVAVTVTGSPKFQAVCSCRDCQERTGSAFGMSVYFPEDQVVGFAGAPSVYRRVSMHGNWLDFRFCATCGTNVWWRAQFDEGLVGVSGILLDGFTFDPDFAVWCQSMPEFVSYTKEMRHFTRGTRDD